MYVIFEHLQDFQLFIDKVRVIVKKEWDTESALFIMEQNTADQATDQIRLRKPVYDWL